LPGGVAGTAPAHDRREAGAGPCVGAAGDDRGGQKEVG